jgi:hypothetical protein
MSMTRLSNGKTVQEWICGMSTRKSIDPKEFLGYMNERNSMESEQVKAFYQSPVYGDERAKAKFKLQSILDTVVDRILKVGGIRPHSIDPEQTKKVLFVFGTADFWSDYRRSSMHLKVIQAFLIKARDWNLQVCGLDEYLTSQKCPSCLDGWYPKDLDSLHQCNLCKKKIGRDSASAHCIALIAISILVGLGRPLHFM